MKKQTLPLLILIMMLLLSACSAKTSPSPAAATPTPTSAIPPTSAPQPTLLPGDEPEQDLSAYAPYYNAEGDFSLALPPDWTASTPQDSLLGAKVTLGPDQESETNSIVYVGDAAKVTKQQALQVLCAGCSPLPKMKDVTVNKLPASLVEIPQADTPPLEWYLLKKGDKLITFSLHDPEMFDTVDAVVQSFTPGKAAYTGPEYSPAAWAAQQTFAAEQGMNPYGVTVNNLQAIDWPDTCIGAADEGEVCDPEVTPGYQGVLKSRQGQAEFHVNINGSQVRLIPGAALAVRKSVAARKNLDEQAVKILMTEPADWPDSCLGLGKADETCAAEMVSGYRVILLVDGQRTEYRTDMTGSNFREVK